MSSPDLDVDAVTALVEHVAATVVAPRFRDLRDGEVREKAPGDVVTTVDTAAEAALVRGLAEIAPGVPVVAEEAAAARPELLDLIVGAPRAWVVDPLDGTQAFIDGSPDYAVMVGLIEYGEAVGGWICLPEHGETFVAQRGSGAFRNGQRLPPTTPPTDLAALRGGLATWHMPPQMRQRLDASGFGPGVTTGRLWSGYHYSRMASGAADFLLYWRTWPWDHTPGAVLLREVGGVSRRLDGTDYRPDAVEQGLLAAADDATYAMVRGHLALG